MSDVRPYQIEQEIAEQPANIGRLLTEEAAPIQAIAAAIRAYNPAFVMFAARGTSDNAALYGQYLLSIRAGMPTALALPSVTTLYEKPINLSRALMIGISQSGQSTDIDAVLGTARQSGALTVGITNDPQSRIARTAEHHIYLHSGEEKAVAATKTYTAQLTALAMLGAALAENNTLRDELQRLPEYMQQTLDLSGAVGARAERYRYTDRIAVIGRGYNYCTAYEISLKIKELCYITSEEYSEADFRHGPIAMIRSGFPVLVVAPSGVPYPLLVDLIDKLNQRDAECLVISDNPALQAHSRKFMALPPGIPEWLSPMCAVLPGQIFAKELALAKDHDVDQPAGLTKVTITR